MSSPSVVILPQVTPRPGSLPRGGEHRFWSGMALCMALVAFAGFAPSYYLKSRFGLGPQLSGLMHLHGALMTAWMLLLVAQTQLVAWGRTVWHRRLGICGIVLLTALVVVFTRLALVRAHEGTLGPGFLPPLRFLAVPLMSIIVVPGLIGAALYYRRRSDYHKRLMLLANLEIITPAAARLAALAGLFPPVAFIGVDLFLVAMALRDRRTLSRLHPATLWGGIFLVASQPLRLAISALPAWIPFARWLAG